MSKSELAADDAEIGFILDETNIDDGFAVIAVLPRLADGFFHMLDHEDHIQGAVARLAAHGFVRCADSAFEGPASSAAAVRTMLRGWGWRELSIDDAEVVQGE